MTIPTTNYKDPDLDREFELLTFEDVTPQDLYDKYEVEVFQAMYKSIIMMIELDLDHVPCMIINGFILDITESNLIENLDNVVLYYEKSEDYEFCGVLSELKKEYLKNKKDS